MHCSNNLYSVLNIFTFMQLRYLRFAQANFHFYIIAFCKLYLQLTNEHDVDIFYNEVDH